MSVRWSDKHGINPTMGVCMFCQRPDNSIGMMGQLPGDAEAPRYSIISDQPCDECVSYMKQGILLLEVSGMQEVRVRVKGGRKETKEYPIATGTLAVVSEAFVNRAINPKELRDQILKKRMAFVTPEDWDRIGIPRENKDYREDGDGQT